MKWDFRKYIMRPAGESLWKTNDIMVTCMWILECALTQISCWKQLFGLYAFISSSEKQLVSPATWDIDYEWF